VVLLVLLVLLLLLLLLLLEIDVVVDVVDIATTNFTTACTTLMLEMAISEIACSAVRVVSNFWAKPFATTSEISLKTWPGFSCCLKRTEADT